MKRFTDEELAKNDGKEGNSAYVTYEGKVYDVSGSALWEGGRHMNSHQAGRNLTKFLESAPHGTEVFERVEEVGEMESLAVEKMETKEIEKREIKAPPELIGKVLKQHPHPVSVHFPVALCITTAIFTVGGILFSGLQVPGFYNLAMAGLFTPMAVAFGFFSWRYNYQGEFTKIFVAKIALTVSFVLLLYATLFIGWLWLDGDMKGEMRWVFKGLTVLCAGNVMALGYLGGRITFPR